MTRDTGYGTRHCDAILAAGGARSVAAGVREAALGQLEADGQIAVSARGRGGHGGFRQEVRSARLVDLEALCTASDVMSFSFATQ